MLFNFRAEPELIDYLGEAARRMGTDKTKVVVAAIDLDRGLEKHLSDVRQELHEYAKSQGLTLADDLPRVLADLVRVGLAAQKRVKR